MATTAIRPRMSPYSTRPWPSSSFLFSHIFSLLTTALPPLRIGCYVRCAIPLARTVPELTAHGTSCQQSVMTPAGSGESSKPPLDRAPCAANLPQLPTTVMGSEPPFRHYYTQSPTDGLSLQPVEIA